MTNRAMDRTPSARVGPSWSHTSGKRALMLTLATVGFAVNFWAWALLSPLGPRFKDSLGLSAFQQALLVAVPVVIRRRSQEVTY
jgi:MFS transporter, NNP family, nitrate/nitrite transporter